MEGKINQLFRLKGLISCFPNIDNSSKNKLVTKKQSLPKIADWNKNISRRKKIKFQVQRSGSTSQFKVEPRCFQRKENEDISVYATGFMSNIFIHFIKQNYLKQRK